MLNVIEWLQVRIASGERGAAAVEYGMLVALIAAVVIATVALIGTQIDGAFNTVLDGLGG